MKSKEQVSTIIAALKTLYPDALCSLDYEKDYELLFSVRLAAQCTDARVNLVFFRLFSCLTLRFHGLQSFLTSDFFGLFFRLQRFQTFPLCLFTDFRSTLLCFQGFLVLRLDLQLTFSRFFFPALLFLHIFLQTLDNGLFCRTDLLFVRSRRHAAPCSRSTRHL